MGTIYNICDTLLRLYNSNINGHHQNRLTVYFAYFRDLSVHNSWVRRTNFNNNNYIVQAYLNPMHHQLVFRFVDALNRSIHSTLHSNPGLTIHNDLIHVFGAHDAPLNLVDDWDVPAREIIKSLPEWGNDDMYTIFECGRTLLFGG